MQDQLVSLFRQSSRSQRRRGKAWYATARMAAERMAGEYGVGLTRVACIMGITSPRCQLVQNIARTERGPEQIELWESTTDPVTAMNQVCDGHCLMIGGN